MSTTTPKAMTPAPLPLHLTEDDFEASDRKKLTALADNSRVLDGDSAETSLVGVLQDSLPSAIAKKVASIVPKNFVVAELQFKLNVSGKVFGTGVAGEVTVKLAPK